MPSRFRVGRVLGWSFLFVLFLSLLAVLHLTRNGFPDAFTRRLIAGLDRQGFCLEMRGAKLDLIDGIVVEDIRLFRKGVFGQPLLEAQRAVIGIGLAGIRKGAPRMTRIAVKGGKVRCGGAGSGIARGLGRWRPGESGPWTLTVALDDCDISGVWIDKLTFKLGVTGEGFRLENIGGILGKGPGAGSLRGRIAVSHDGSYCGHLTTLFDPREIVPCLHAMGSEDLVRLIGSFVFQSPPRMEADFSGEPLTGETLKLAGRFAAKDFTYNSVGLSSVESRVVVNLGSESSTVTLDPVVVTRDRGSARAGLTIDLRQRTVRFRGASTLDPIALARLISPRGPDCLIGYNFAGPVKLTDVKGLVSVTDSSVCEIEGRVDAKSLGAWRVVADQCEFQYRRSGITNFLCDVRADICGGVVTGAGSFFYERGSTNVRSQVKMQVENADLRRITEVLGLDADSKDPIIGRVWGEIEFDGVLGKGMERTIGGRGTVKVREGHLFRIPLLGPLSGILARNVPGVDFLLRQSDAGGVFEIKAGKICTEDFKIEGDVLSLNAGGWYDLGTDQLDFDVEVRLLKKKTFVGGIVQTVMLPVTRLLRVRLRGAVERPEWTPLDL